LSINSLETTPDKVTEEHNWPDLEPKVTSQDSDAIFPPTKKVSCLS